VFTIDWILWVGAGAIICHFWIEAVRTSYIIDDGTIYDGQYDSESAFAKFAQREVKRRRKRSEG
jgi:hypothetical protein